jgi:hypothetical protein
VKRRKVNWVKQGFSVSLHSCIGFGSWKKSSFNCIQKKIVNMVAHTAITWRYLENVKSFLSKNKNSTPNDKIWEDSSHQALTYFSFSEFLSSDFRYNINSRNFAMLFSIRNTTVKYPDRLFANTVSCLLGCLI